MGSKVLLFKELMCWISSFSFFPFVYCLFLSINFKCIKTNCYKLVFPLGLSKKLCHYLPKTFKGKIENYLCFGFQLSFIHVPIKLKDQNLFLFMFPSSFVPNKFPNCSSYMCSHFLSIIFIWSPLHGSQYWFTCSLWGNWTFSFLLLHRP